MARMLLMLQFLLRLVFFVRADALYAQDGVLRPAVAFFLDQQLLLPQRVIKRIALLDGGVTKSLGVVHATPALDLLEQRLDLPLDVGRRLLRPAAKVHVVLHLEPAKLVFQQRQIFIDCQSGRSKSVVGMPRVSLTRTIPQRFVPSHVLEVQRLPRLIPFPQSFYPGKLSIRYSTVVAISA